MEKSEIGEIFGKIIKAKSGDSDKNFDVGESEKESYGSLDGIIDSVLNGKNAENGESGDFGESGESKKIGENDKIGGIFESGESYGSGGYGDFSSRKENGETEQRENAQKRDSSLENIENLAKNLTGGADLSKAISAFASFAPLINSAAKNVKKSETQTRDENLICAIKPYLSRDRQDFLDRIQRIFDFVLLMKNINFGGTK